MSKTRLDPNCWDGYKKAGTKMKGGVKVNNCVKIESIEQGEMCDSCAKSMLEDIRDGVITSDINEAEYRGRKVTLNKPMRTGTNEPKKFKVYVKDPKTGNVKLVRFGHQGGGVNPDKKTMKIKKSNAERRKSFRARHNCDNPGPKTKARYWSCRAW